jgi:hypothetical protein
LTGGRLSNHLTVELPDKDKLLGLIVLAFGVRKRRPENQHEPGELELVADADTDGVELAVLKALAALPKVGCMHTSSVAAAIVDQAYVPKELQAANAELVSATAAFLVPQERRLKHLRQDHPNRSAQLVYALCRAARSRGRSPGCCRPTRTT